MSHVAVEKVNGNDVTGTGILDEIRNLGERIRKHAFELFEDRHYEAGRDLDDWFRAEQDLISIPQSELIEKEDNFTLRLNTPGFKADEIKVTALPGALVVKAESRHERDKTEGKVRFSEFGRKMVFRQYPLPEPIAADKVTANLDHGVLQLTAPKAKPELVAKSSAAA
jgi:HSP20 family protein